MHKNDAPCHMKETIEKLKKSPLFNLSLSSKELFHNNFLYWIGHNYPSEFGGLFSKYLNEQPEDSCIKKMNHQHEIILPYHLSGRSLRSRNSNGCFLRNRKANYLLRCHFLNKKVQR